MRVTIRFFTMLREITGKKEQTLTFQKEMSPTVNTALKKLSEEYGKSFTDYVYDSRTSEPKGFLQFLINGKSITSPKGLDTALEDGDVLAIIPPVGGG